jgi:hypothetical protein
MFNLSKIEHYTDRTFLDKLRVDLLAVQEHVLLLSPFVSKNRSSHYYPILLTLKQRHIPMDVYIRPKAEQPLSLQPHFEPVRHKLTVLGANVHLRQGMHEKVGILDDRILWHGSLNILSHNDTRESMLRIESPELIQEIRGELLGEIFGTPHEKTPQTPEPTTAPSCPTCNSPMLWFDDANLWICTNSPACSGTLASQQPTDTGTQPQVQKTGLQCPLCQGEMVIHRGVFTRISCSNVECGYRMDPRLSAGLIRLWRRRGQL